VIGLSVHYDGLEVFTIEDGKIGEKDSYLKSSMPKFKRRIMNGLWNQRAGIDELPVGGLNIPRPLQHLEEEIRTESQNRIKAFFG
jgi:hypothetical protein